MHGPLLLMINALALAGVVGFALARKAPDHPVIHVVPLGAVAQDLVDEAAAALAQETTLTVVIGAPRALPAEAFRVADERYAADEVLALLEPHASGHAWKTVYITSAPLEVGEQPWDSPLSGLGTVRGRSCILSTATFEVRSGTRASLLRRVGTLVLHETGHAMGLHHCGVGGCVMRESNGDTVAWADLSHRTYCVLCRLKLPAGLLRTAPVTASAISTLH